MIIRAAKAEDLPELLRVYDYAREFMARTGNPTQWRGGYPAPELLREDIRTGRGFVGVDADGRVHCAFALLFGDEPTYQVLEDGAWLNDAPYGTIHRLAGDGTVRGCFDACIAFCRARCANLRADTHADNRIMQRLLERAGFQRCGIIYAADGSARIAYQWSCSAACGSAQFGTEPCLLWGKEKGHRADGLFISCTVNIR